MIERFLYDEVNLAKLADHGLTPDRVDAVLRGPFTFMRNRKDQNAESLVIGVDDEFNCITIPIDPTNQRGVWRPRTAYPCKQSEWTNLPKGWRNR